LMYRTIKISEIANLKYGKMPDKKKVSDDGYPIFTGYKVSGYYPEYNIEENTLVVVARGVGGTGDVKYVEEKSYLTNLSISLELKDDEANKKYLYYLLNQSNLRILDSGSAQSQITIRDLSDFILTLPSLNYQNSVANILSSLDDKIENNNAIIANLEEQAQAIFKSWFVDFEPFQDEEFVESEVGNIPKSFVVKKLEDISTIQNGYAFKSNDYIEKGIKVIRTLNIENNFLNESNYVYLPSEFHTDNSHLKHQLNLYDTLLVMVGSTIGKSDMILSNNLPSLQNQNM